MDKTNNLHRQVEIAVGAPAVVLDKPIKLTQNFNKRTTIKRIHHYWNTLGPGLIVL